MNASPKHTPPPPAQLTLIRPDKARVGTAAEPVVVGPKGHALLRLLNEAGGSADLAAVNAAVWNEADVPENRVRQLLYWVNRRLAGRLRVGIDRGRVVLYR